MTSPRWSMPAIATAASIAACGGDQAYTVVTIDSRSAVRDVRSLEVTLTNEGSTVTNTVQLDGRAFPVTFSIEAPGRTGDLGIQIDALGADALLVGRGAGTTTVGAPAAAVMLEPADFVVNTDFAENQELSNYLFANGFQLSATSDGVWTAVYNTSCEPACDLFGRRFDADGRPLATQIAAGTNSFKLTTSLTQNLAVPAVASAGAVTVGVWNFHDPDPATAKGIACRAFDANGAASALQLNAVVDEFPDLVSVAAMSTGNFAAVWDGRVAAALTIRSSILTPDCAPMLTASVSTVAGLNGPLSSTLAVNGDRILYAWTLDGNVRIRLASAANAFLSADQQLVAKTATDQIEFVRAAPLGTGFAVVARWAPIVSPTGRGRIELYRVSREGLQLGGPTLITDRAGADFQSRESFGLAHRAGDGALLAVWSACNEVGDGTGCGVFGRLIRATGVPVGEPFVLSTTVTGDQLGPSAAALPGSFVTAWTDRSAAAPDTAGTGVRARIIYPAFDDAAGVIGAACEPADVASCGAGLACGQGTDGVARCFATCDQAGTPPLCPGGGACTSIGAAAACLF